MYIIVLILINCVLTIFASLQSYLPEKLQSSECLLHLISIAIPKTEPIVFFGASPFKAPDLPDHTIIFYDPALSDHYNTIPNSSDSLYGQNFILFEKYTNSHLQTLISSLINSPLFNIRHSTRGRYIVVAPLVEFNEDLFKLLWHMEMIQIVFVLKDNKIYSASPFSYANQCGTQVKQIDYFGKCTDVSTVPFSYLSDVFNDLNGCPIRVQLNGNQIQRPFIIYQQKPRRNGMFVQLLNTIASMMNATIEYYWKSSEYQIEHVVKDLLDKHIDLYVPLYNVRLDMEMFIELTSPIYRGKFVWVLAKSRTNDISVNLRHFRGIEYSFLLSCILFILWFKLFGLTKNNLFQSFTNSLTFFITISLQQTSRQRLTSYISKYLVFLQILLTFMLVKFLECVLSSAMTTRRPVNLIQTEDELFHSNLQPLGFKPPGGRHIDSFNVDFISRIIERNEGVRNVLNDVASNNNLSAYIPEVVLNSYPKIKDRLRELPPKYEYVLLYARIVSRRGYHAMEVVANICEMMANTGLYEKWVEDYTAFDDYGYTENTAEEEISHLFDISMIYVYFVCFATMVFIIELVWFHGKSYINKNYLTSTQN